MKKGLLFILVVGLIAAPKLSLAGGPEDQNVLLASNRLSEQELGMATGQGFEVTPSDVKNQDGRIVIWDEWAWNASGGNGANASSPGNVSINYSSRQATLTAGR